MSTIPCPLNSVYTEIGREECIGNSLSKINNNFQNFKNTHLPNYYLTVIWIVKTN